MNCKKAEKHILLQDSGELGTRKTVALEKHLSECKPCQEFKQILTSATQSLSITEEPAVKSMQNVLRAARQNTPSRPHHIPLMVLKPALGLSLAVLIGLNILSNKGPETTSTPSQKSMVLVMNDTQFLEPEDQVVSIMYDGLSDDDLAFNFLMTYEEDSDG